MASLALAILPSGLGAQTLITNIATTTIAGTPVTTDGYTFDGTMIRLDAFSTATGNTYATTTLANQAFVRRNTTSGNANQSSVWYRQNATGTGMLGTHASNYASLLLNNNVAGGSDNTFANGTTVQDGNIERLDFVFTGGLTATAGLGFAVFERGAINVHDGFKIAVITGWDAVNNVPTAYGTLKGQAGNWGSTNVVDPGFSYTLFRYNQGDNITTATANTETGTQGIGGVFFTLADLGITPGTKIYGYSLFGYDVTDGGNSANLINYNNATYFPIATTNATGTGGIDLATINGIAFVAIPEPSTYLLGGVALMALAAWRRQRARRTAQACSSTTA